RLGDAAARDRLPRGVPRSVLGRAAGDRALPAPVAAVPRRVRRGDDQAPRRSLLARPHVPPVPPRDAADAERVELVLPPPPRRAAQGRGARQPRRAALRAVVALQTATRRRRRRA